MLRPGAGRAERRRFLEAARLVAAATLGVLAQVAVDMPDGYLGARDEVTVSGAVYALALVALAAVAILAALRRSGARGLLASCVYASSVGVFVPALAVDPVVAGVVVFWNLVLLAQQLFPAARPAPGASPRGVVRFLVYLPALRHLALMSLFVTVAIAGYELSDRLLVRVGCLLLGYGTMALATPVLLWLRREHRSKLALLAPAPLLLSLLAMGSPPLMLGLLAIGQVLLLGALAARHQAMAEIVRYFYDYPSRLVVVTFFAAIVAGTVLLTFPAASATSHSLNPLDALFTATSAICVTGLIVLDTPRDFSTFGQVVILGLIQVGGLGIMVLSTFATLLLGGRLGLRGERALSELLELRSGPLAYRLTRFIVLVTLGIEAVGAVALTIFFARAGLSFQEAAWRGVFHSVSAFCNAGFALQSDSLVMFQRSPAVILVFALLIVAGGLGFAVIAGLAERLRPGRNQRLTVQVRVVLIASALLIVAGTALFLATEWRRSLAHLGLLDKLANAFFQSVTLRTAGFNTVDFAGLATPTLLFMILFMFIGASPGSTAGGVKTTTVAVLLAAVRASVRAAESVVLMRREVPPEIVLRSLAIVVISSSIVAVGCFLVLLFVPLPFEQLLFETVSAFGTVGLSLGATPHLGPVGKLVIIGVMFVGRIGPLTLALVLGSRRDREPVSGYAETRLMVG